jgi:hypothetical protein
MELSPSYLDFGDSYLESGLENSVLVGVAIVEMFVVGDAAFFWKSRSQLISSTSLWSSENRRHFLQFSIIIVAESFRSPMRSSLSKFRAKKWNFAHPWNTRSDNVHPMHSRNVLPMQAAWAEGEYIYYSPCYATPLFLSPQRVLLVGADIIFPGFSVIVWDRGPRSFQAPWCNGKDHTFQRL